MLCSWRKVQQNLGVAMSQGSGPVQFSSVQLVMSDSLWPSGLQHTRLPCPSPAPRVCWNSCPSSWWCHLTISSSVVPFSSWPQSFPAPGYFPMSQFFAAPVSPFSRSEEGTLVSQGPCCLQSWLGAVPAKCALSTHILTDRFQSTDTEP